MTTLYVRSSLLGHQVVAELDAKGQQTRAYIYAQQQLVAVRDGKGTLWVHSDPVTKSQRLTDEQGRVVEGVELDPWGAETSFSFTSKEAEGREHKRRFTTYERDGNGSDDAMHRRYNPL